MQPISYAHNTFPSSPINPVDPNYLNSEAPASQVDPRYFQQEAPHIELDPSLYQAESKLHRVIRFGNKYDLPKLLDEAVSAGAQLNHPTCYECNSLVIAVRAKNFQAISPLMVRGARIPAPAHDQVDLLIEACRTGDVNMAIELITVAKINLHTQDATGKTALHYSIIGGSQELTLLLLSHGADPNVEATQMTESECSRIFGNGISFQGLAVTPLMIAVRLGDDYLVHLLLSHGADPNRGACSPLIIAAFSGKPDIFNRLLCGNAKLAQCREYRGYTGLYACVVSRLPAQYLSQLVSHHDFSRDDGSISSPLGLAVERRLYDAVSLFLVRGASIEDHETTDEPVTTWQAALPNGCYGSAMADLLTAKNSAFIQTQAIEKIENQLLFIISKIHHPAALSSRGYFTSMLFAASEKIKFALDNQHDLTDRQKTLLFASILSEFLPKTLPPEPPRNGQNLPVYVLWQNKTKLAAHRQREALQLASNTLIEYAKQKLTEATYLAFFLERSTQCPDDTSMRRFIEQYLQQELGIPKIIAKYVADAWNKAARWSVDWKVAQDSDTDSNRFLESLARNLLSKAANEPIDGANALTIQCRQVLETAIPHTSRPLHQFCANPVAWLRKFENRASLADAHPDLAYQCQIKLGLPLAACEAIVNAWQQAIRAARDLPWSMPQQLHRILDWQLALHIADTLNDAHTKEVIPDVDKLVLELWRSQVRASHASQLLVADPTSAAATGRKRPAEQEAPDAPPAKEART